MKFIYFNDTKRVVNIHPATFRSCRVDYEPIRPLEERVFLLPKGAYPWVKMWDYGKVGLSILVSAVIEDAEDEPKDVWRNDLVQQIEVNQKEGIEYDA